MRNKSVSYNQRWTEHHAEDVLSKLILLTFIFLFVIVMMNVLNAFAIGDIQVNNNSMKIVSVNPAPFSNSRVHKFGDCQCQAIWKHLSIKVQRTVFLDGAGFKSNPRHPKCLTPLDPLLSKLVY